MSPMVISVMTSYMISSALLGNTAQTWQLFLVVTFLVIVSAVLAYLDVIVSHDTAYRILAKLRNTAYDKIDELAPAAMENRHSAALTSIVLEDIELLEWFYAHTIGQIVVAILLPGAALILLGAISPVLPITLIPFIVLMVCVPACTASQANTQGLSVRTAFSELNAQIVDGVQGLKDIISFGWQNAFFDRFRRALQAHQQAQMGYAMRSGEEARRFQLIIGLGSLCGEITAAVLTVTGRISPVWLLPVFVLSSAIFAPLQDALAMSTNYGLIFSAAKRLFDLLQASPTVEDRGTAQFSDVLSAANAPVTVAFDHVAFTYPSEDGSKKNPPLFHDLTFSVSSGETVALVGASGSGKTTAARLLQRFWDVDGGTITINGTDIRAIHLEALRDIITVVPQEVYLFNQTVSGNLRMAKLDATQAEIETAAEEAQASRFIEKLPNQYDTQLGERGLRISGGEKQRLSIAQAFLKNSPVLVLDEASANLDSETERQINQAVERLKQGRATLVIAHRVSTIRSADRIVVIRDGCVDGIGTFDELMRKSPYFARLIGSDQYAEK